MSPKPRLDIFKPIGPTLARLGKACAKGDVPLPLMAEVMAGLGRLPPATIGWADAQIAYRADLQNQPNLRPLFMREFVGNPWTQERIAARPHLAQVLIFHRNGRVREAALKQLQTVPESPFALAALAWRLNDWVEQVRYAARLCAERLFPLIPAPVVVSVAPFLLDRWRRWGRWGPENVAMVESLFDRADVAAALAQRLQSDPTGPMAITLRYALRHSTMDRHLPALAANAVQPTVRATALDALIHRRASWPTGFGREWIDQRFNLYRRITVFAHRDIEATDGPDELIAQGLADRSAVVRRVAADALIERRATYPGLDAAIAKLAADRSSTLRERGAFLERKQTEAQGSPPP